MQFTEYHANKIGRITMDGVITEYPIPTAKSDPRCITQGPGRTVWFTELARNKIAKLYP